MSDARTFEANPWYYRPGATLAKHSHTRAEKRSGVFAGDRPVVIRHRRHRPVVTVYTRKQCGLCRTMEQVVARVAGRTADIVLVDIDADPALVDRYTIRVPVVMVDGVEIAEYHVDPRILRAHLRAARRR
jgi:hypothetical protein